jgi:hypothetical protein
MPAIAEISQGSEVVLWNLIFQAKVVKQGFGTGVLSHHDQHASENRDPAQHEHHSAACTAIHALITATFSTPTPVLDT